MEFYFIPEMGENVEIIGAQSLSIGRGVETSGRYSYDASHTPQGTFRRVRNTAGTITINATISPEICAQKGVSVPDHVSTCAGIVGARVGVIWCGNDLGKFIVKSCQFSADLDPVWGFATVSMAFSLVEGRVHNPQPATSVRTL